MEGFCSGSSKPGIDEAAMSLVSNVTGFNIEKQLEELKAYQKLEQEK